MKDYIAAIGQTGLGFAAREPLSAREAALERLLMGLRTCEGVAWADLVPLGLSQRSTSVQDMGGQGLVGLDAVRLKATAKGRPVLDGVIRALVGNAEVAHG